MPEKSLNTIHIDSEKLWSGGQVQVSGLCKYLREWGHNVTLVCRPGSKLQEWADSMGIRSIPVEMKSTMSLSAVLALRRVIASEKPDVVHLHTSRAHVLGSFAAKLAGAPMVIATRRMDDPINMVFYNKHAYGNWTNALVAISGAVRDVMVQCGVDSNKIRLIESGVDVDNFANVAPDKDLRANLDIDPAAAIVCTTATLAERKGIKYLIEAVSMLKNRNRNIHLIIAGIGELRAELEKLANDLGVNASFLGFYKDTPALLASIDVFVMASLAEGLGVAVLEAMAAGKPVVASAVGGLRESVIDGKTGFQVPPADSSALAHAIDTLVSSPKMAREYGLAGQERVRSNYSLENMAKKNEALYFELMNR